MSDEAELEALLRQLIVDWENEVVEFKAAGEDYSTGTIGKYFSALSNEANLRGNVRLGWCSVKTTRRTQ